MFLLNGSPLQVDVAFSYNGVSYPANWLRLTTLAEKEAIGITEVPDPERYDDRFYWNFGLPKDLDDLKKSWSQQVDNMAYTMLLPSDWMAVRKTETGTEIPADWATYRAAVRSAAATHKTALNAATDIDGFVSVATTMQWPRNPNATI
jgi:hypothetical protein